MSEPIENATPVASQESASEQAAENQETNLEASESTETEGAADASSITEEQKADAAKVKKEEKKLLRKLKLKVDGKEFDEELPFDIPEDPKAIEYMQKQLQLSKAAQKRMAEHSQLQKEVASFIEELKKNPRKVLADPNIGVDIKALAAAVIEEEIANSQKSPEQLEKERLESRLKELEEERKKEKEDFEKREFERLQAQEYERYDTLMTKALETSGLPKTPYIVKKMADYMLLGLQDGQDVSPEDVIPLVREEMQKDLKEMFAVMPDEVIEQLVGKDVIGRIRKKSVAKVKEKGVPPTPVSKAIQDTGTTGKVDEQPKQKMSIKEWLKV